MKFRHTGRRPQLGGGSCWWGLTWRRGWEDNRGCPGSAQRRAASQIVQSEMFASLEDEEEKKSKKMGPMIGSIYVAAYAS